MEVNATSKSLSSSKIMIGGEEVKLDKIAITYKYIYPDTLTSYPVSYSNTNTNNYFYYLFEFDGRVYSIDSTNDIIENKELFIYSTSTQNDVNKLNFDLIRLFKNYYPYYKPASYPATR